MNKNTKCFEFQNDSWKYLCPIYEFFLVNKENIENKQRKRWCPFSNPDFNTDNIYSEITSTGLQVQDDDTISTKSTQHVKN